MRYPDTSFMKRTFDLARNRLGFSEKEMITYICSDDDTYLYYNGISVTKKQYNAGSAAKEDVFNVSQSKGGDVPDSYVADGPGKFWNVYLDELRQLFVKFPFDVAFKMLKKFDGHSVTSYLTFVKELPYEVIKWYETMESRTGLFDASLVETVLASLVFNDPRYKDKTINWFCFKYVV